MIGQNGDAVADKLEEKIAQVGEKISLRRNEKMVEGTGAIAVFIWVVK